MAADWIQPVRCGCQPLVYYLYSLDWLGMFTSLLNLIFLKLPEKSTELDQTKIEEKERYA